jgi:hypothetical protein
MHTCIHTHTYGANDDNAALNHSANTRTRVTWDNYDPVHPIPAEGLVP